MVLNITQYGNPILRKKCREVTSVTEDIKNLADDMVETMNHADGIGIAAPQVGVDLQIAVVDVSHDSECVSYCKVDGEPAQFGDIMPLIFINPKLELLGDKENEQEGCLSIQEVRAHVKRPTEVKASLTLLSGKTITLETDGLLARAIQHEVDHLNGVLFVDRVSAAVKSRLRKKLKDLTV